jgi:WD40 repeat protein
MYAVAFDGKIVASGGLDTTVHLWDVENVNTANYLGPLGAQDGIDTWGH